MSRRSLSTLLACSLAAALAIGIATTAGGQSGSTSDRALYGSLSGLNEIGEDGERGAGDRNGRGSASAIIDGGRICYALTVKNIQDPVAAHIHRGGRTVNGPVVVEFEAPSAGDPGASSGCVRIASDLARRILRNPQNYYFNVHTPDFTGGAVRGQVRTARF
jgi:CHRD domain-containing protein